MVRNSPLLCPELVRVGALEALLAQQGRSVDDLGAALQLPK